MPDEYKKHVDNLWIEPGKQPFMGLKSPKDRRKEDVTAQRRAIVAQLLDEGLSRRDIWRLLKEKDSDYYFPNPETGKPWGESTIEKDEEALREYSQAVTIREARLSKVRSLRRRGLSDDEIFVTLSNPNSKSYTVNPKTGRPYTLNTIHADLEELRIQAYSLTQQHTDSWRAKLLTELEEIKRAAWAKDNLGIALRAIDMQIEITGTARPKENINHNIRYDGTAKQQLRDKIGNMIDGVLDEIAEDIEFTDANLGALPDGSDVTDDSAE
jgi:hypothetical protein